MFEVELIRSTDQKDETDEKKKESEELNRRDSHDSRSILLKGQMRYIEDIKAIVFLCSPL